MAIQWHISLHLGFLRDGASGSVRVMVYVMPRFVGWRAFVMSASLMVGRDCRCFGLMVLPSFADFLDQEIEIVRLGRKSSMTGLLLVRLV